MARYEVTAAGLGPEQVLLEGIPGAQVHDGGRLAFGPDGKLYITTGDARVPALAQEADSLAGKILRLNPDGTVPVDNPFPGSPVYSLGHRNPQGLAWDVNTGALYSTEHGPSGEQSLCCRDELNRIEPRGNYGWPLVTAAPGEAGYLDPLLHSGDDTWAPAGLLVYDGEALALARQPLVWSIARPASAARRVGRRWRHRGGRRAAIRGRAGSHPRCGSGARRIRLPHHQQPGWSWPAGG